MEKEKKILVGTIKDGDGVSIFFDLVSPSRWNDLEWEIKNALECGYTPRVRFMLKTKEWFNKLPEYD